MCDCFICCVCFFVICLSSLHHFITKTRLYNYDPLKPHFYIVKLGFTGVYIIFLNLLKKHRLCVLVRTAFLTSTHNLCFYQNLKNINFLSENFPFLVVKFLIYLNRLVFVMWCLRKAVLPDCGYLHMFKCFYVYYLRYIYIYTCIPRITKIRFYLINLLYFARYSDQHLSLKNLCNVLL